MALQAQAVWGRPLEQYVGSYSQTEMATWPSELDKRQLQEAKEAIERISKVDLGSPSATNHVELSDLETVLKATCSVTIYPYFAVSDLVRGCIHLMSNIPLSREEKQSPFSYEYGYLCFRILMVAVGACLIGRWKTEDNLEELMEEMATTPDTEPIHYFSSQVMGTVFELVSHSDGLDHDSYNCVIGWSRCDDCREEEELASRTDCSVLLAMLWADSKQFFKAMLWTYSPGVSGVAYLLWRYACYERYLKDQPSPDRYMIPFVDIFWRCTLSTTPDQTLALSFLRRVNVHPGEIWDEMPIKPEPGDAKLICQAAVHQLNLASSPLRSGDYAIRPEDVPSMFNFVHRHWLPECVEYLPSLFGASINRMWVAFLKEEMEHELSLVAYRATLEWFCGDLGRLTKLGANESIKAQVLIQILKNDLVELIGRLMLYLNPTPLDTKSEGEEGALNLKLLWECEHIFKSIRTLPPKGALKEYFDACGTSWWRLYWRLDSLTESPDLSPDLTPFYKVDHTAVSDVSKRTGGWVWLGKPPAVG